MPDDVTLAKIEIIERCLRRISDVYAGDPANLFNDFTKQDSILLNLERACQAAIDLALHLVRVRALGLPKETRDAFALLEQSGLIPQDLGESLRAMAGFRNIAVHNYRQLDMQIVERIIKDRLPELRQFASKALELSSEG